MNSENNTTESEGLGDTIAKLSELLGFDKLADGVAKSMGKSDCGCNKRRKKLNELFPYNSKGKK